VTLRRSMTALGALVIASVTLAMPSSGTTPRARKSPHPAESKSERLCFRDATSPPQPLPMPRPTRLLRTISLQWSGSIVLAPAPASDVGAAMNPSLIWRFAPTMPKGSHSQLFLAYFSASVPATLEPDGSLVPFSNHVLAWVLLTQHTPFDTAGISPPAGGTIPPVSCTFDGQDITAWNATTGAELQGGGGHAGHAPSQPSVISPDVTPGWSPLTLFGGD
jgi:hypothetical protein